VVPSLLPLKKGKEVAMAGWQRKRSNEKITRKTKKKSFPTYNTHFFELLLLSNLETFLFLIHFKRFKLL
jgi:hypothetical protein